MAKILIVEDQEHLRTALREAIQTHGHEAFEAIDGRSAQEIIETLPRFDLILSDIQMPYVSGFDLLEWIKENTDTPVILMTGFSKITEIWDPKDYGCDGFLPKPFSYRDFKALAAQWISL